MASIAQLCKRVWHRKPPPPRHFSNITTHPIASERRVEEETLPFYEPEQYYPVQTGDVFISKYQVVGKLGYGAYSTAWLCRDLREHKYATLKISTHLRKAPLWGRRELAIYEHLDKTRSSHRGQAFIREVWNTFEISGPHGHHQCLVQPPMHMSVLDMMELNPEPLTAPLLRIVLKHLLTALDFLHTEAEVIHTDLKADNLMFTVADKSILEDFEKAELKDPSPRKAIDEKRTIYTSRSFRMPKDRMWGYPVLCDFGEAKIGKVQENGRMVQPHIYRAPEVTFEMPWGPMVDVWNVAALVWDLFEGKHLFHHLNDEDGHHDPFKHMAQIVGYLGLPSKEFVSWSETASQCFDPDGNWIADEHEIIPNTSLEEVETRLEGREKARFLAFIRSMLKWIPEERKTAKELLNDPWLNERPDT